MAPTWRLLLPGDSGFCYYLQIQHEGKSINDFSGIRIYYKHSNVNLELVIVNEKQKPRKPQLHLNQGAFPVSILNISQSVLQRHQLWPCLVLALANTRPHAGRFRAMFNWKTEWLSS